MPAAEWRLQTCLGGRTNIESGPIVLESTCEAYDVTEVDCNAVKTLSSYLTIILIIMIIILSIMIIVLIIFIIVIIMIITFFPCFNCSATYFGSIS